MEADETKKPAPAVEEEGEKVSGGAAAGNQTDATEASPAQGDELMPEGESKKEEIDGYNEHPDQAKVGGG